MYRICTIQGGLNGSMDVKSIIIIVVCAVIIAALIAVPFFLRRRNPGRTLSPLGNAISWVLIYALFSFMPISSHILELILRVVILIILFAELFFTRKLGSAGIAMPRGSLFGFLFYVPMAAIVGLFFVGGKNFSGEVIVPIIEKTLLFVAGEVIFTGLLFKSLSERNLLLAYASRMFIMPIIVLAAGFFWKISSVMDLIMMFVMNVSFGFMSAAYFRKSGSILPLIVFTAATAALSVICTIPVYIYIVISVIAAGYGVWMLWRA